MPDPITPFANGVEAMRASVIAKIESWQNAQWSSRDSLSQAEVHELLNAIADDIRIATVVET